MARFFHIILMFSVLMAPSVWAFHDVDLSDNSEHIYAQVTEQCDDADDSCDHFCHASAHLIGLFSSNDFDIHDVSNSSESVLRNLISSFSSPPVTPPPIS